MWSKDILHPAHIMFAIVWYYRSDLFFRNTHPYMTTDAEKEMAEKKAREEREKAAGNAHKNA